MLDRVDIDLERKELEDNEWLEKMDALGCECLEFLREMADKYELSERERYYNG